MKLYKFRSLGDGLSLCRASKILETGQFWCSRFWELNDPMEGVYSFKADDGVPIGEVFSGKARYVICSFSGPDALKNPVMWGYYANGFKGMAIEIEVSAEKIEVVEYLKDVHQWSTKDGPATNVSDRVMKILTTKLSRWKHEQEFRFIDEGDPGAKRIGRITKVYFGNPYGNTVNQNDVSAKSKELCAFCAYRSDLQELAKKNGIGCNFVTVADGKVRAPGLGAG